MTLTEIIASDVPCWKFTKAARKAYGIGRSVRAYKLREKGTPISPSYPAKPQISGIPGSSERLEALAAWYASGIESSAFSDE
jgi:hypothetical protein